jgi:hypothetical protein
MAPTLTESLLALRERLSEPSAAAWSDSELTRLLNEGCREIAVRTEYISATADIVVSAGQYTVPVNTAAPGFLRVHKAEWCQSPGGTVGASDQIYPLDYTQITNLDSVRGSGQQTIQGTPSIYSTWGASTVSQTAKLILYPRPDSAGVLRIWYYALPAVVATGTDVLGCPNGWEHLVYDYAEFRAKVKDGDDSWQVSKQDFESRLDEFRKMFARLSDENDRIGADAFYYPNQFGADEWGW